MATRPPSSARSFHCARLSFSSIFAIILIAVSSSPAYAQSFQVIYSFTGGPTGSNSQAGLTIDRAGNLYGTTNFGGSDSCSYECGTVFKLSPRGDGWLLDVLYSFQPNGNFGPQSRAIIGPNGSLYSTTYAGGTSDYGTVFNLQPPAHATANVLAPWTDNILYSFGGGFEGTYPINADVAFDSAGNLYGTTSTGGYAGYGVVYVLSPSGGSWIEENLYAFAGGIDGASPTSGVIADQAGNLYGATYAGGPQNCGTVYELSDSDGSWKQTMLYTFTGGDDGCNPYGGLTFDAHGNLIGTTEGNGGSAPTAFMLSPSGGSWTYRLLYTLGVENDPRTELTVDSAGNLYGTTTAGGAYGYGSVFRLSPSNGGWSYTDLHDFTNGSDGANPHSDVLIDAKGNLFGTTSDGALNGPQCVGGCGTIWEITP